uniref:THAP domain-containing protein 1 n=1 Tax=Maylandia zebra TaxID=106582 RepID=A0A3P9DMD3_9CICH
MDNTPHPLHDLLASHRSTFSERLRLPKSTTEQHRKSVASKFNGILSFHAFPTHSDLRRQWLLNIRRDHFTITSHTRVCCRHFASDQLIEPTTLDGRRRLIKGAVPTLFEWNGYKVEPPRRSVWERTERRPELVPPDDQEEHSLTRDHDYCSVPEPSALDISASAAEDLSKDVETLRKEIQELRVQREFGCYHITLWYLEPHY